jgi:NAD/NADP transhydrogenase alpha subunit
MNIDSRNITSNNGSASMAWMEWVTLMGYAGLVAIGVSCLLGAAVVVLGS